MSEPAEQLDLIPCATPGCELSTTKPVEHAGKLYCRPCAERGFPKSIAPRPRQPKPKPVDDRREKTTIEKYPEMARLPDDGVEIRQVRDLDHYYGGDEQSLDFEGERREQAALERETRIPTPKRRRGGFPVDAVIALKERLHARGIDPESPPSLKRGRPSREEVEERDDWAVRVAQAHAVSGVSFAALGSALGTSPKTVARIVAHGREVLKRPCGQHDDFKPDCPACIRRRLIFGEWDDSDLEIIGSSVAHHVSENQWPKLLQRAGRWCVVYEDETVEWLSYAGNDE